MYRTKMAEDKRTIVILIRVRKQGDISAMTLFCTAGNPICCQLQHLHGI